MERWTYSEAKVADRERSVRGTSKAVTPRKSQKHSSPGVIRQKVGKFIPIRQRSGVEPLFSLSLCEERTNYC